MENKSDYTLKNESVESTFKVFGQWQLFIKDGFNFKKCWIKMSNLTW